MKKIIVAVAALVLFESVACALDPDWMWGQKIEFSRVSTIESAESSPEETTSEIVVFECVNAMETTVEGTSEETEEETEAETEEETTEEQEDDGFVLYEVDGIILDETVQRFLYGKLSEHGLEWWMPYAMMQICQESHFNPRAVSFDGKDKGLLQYRELYWAETATAYGYPDADVYDYFAQIAVYVNQVAKRVNEGKSIEEIISDHYTGECGFNAEYVNDVLGWQNTLKEAN